jgi:hypothetical protein
VKLIAYNPYLALGPATLENVRLLVSKILNGEYWSAEFLPKDCAPLAIMGLVAIGWRGHVAKREARAVLIVLFALTMFVPCTYYTLLWNRLRYLWPFATPWFIGLACLARTFGGFLTWLDARAGAATTALLCGACAGSFATHLDWVIEDVAQSASGISRQQVALGHWANDNLPRDARIGVNDTGAIAYFGNRRTFDVVGLTTPSEGRYWVAGSGSRFEHYERIDRSLLPTHFIVYPEWMDCEPVLGRELHEAIVTDSSILGGPIMRVHLARWDELGTGERPWTTLAAIEDAVDVADLESESEHAYELLGAHEREEVTMLGNAPDGALVADGGRTNRVRDRFAVRLPPHGFVHMIARVESRVATVLVVHADGQNVARAAIEAGPWTEVVFDLPDAARAERTTIEVTSEGSPFTSFHYFFGAGG